MYFAEELLFNVNFISFQLTLFLFVHSGLLPILFLYINTDSTALSSQVIYSFIAISFGVKDLLESTDVASKECSNFTSNGRGFGLETL